MKINHEMANEWFSKLPIETKRHLFCIVNELMQAEKKHPSWPADHIHAAAIVGEESGELLQAAINHKYENAAYYSIHREAIQTAATCVRLLNNMPHKKLPGEVKDRVPRFQPVQKKYTQPAKKIGLSKS